MNNPFPSLARHNMQHCITLPGREDALSFIPLGGIVAEIGVAYGDFSRCIINSIKPREFHAIDTFSFLRFGHEPGGESRLSKDLTHKQYYKNRFNCLIDAHQLFVHEGLSWEVLLNFKNDYFDYIYVDADHCYDSVKKDIAIARHKIKLGGFIQFNDYTFYDWLIKEEYGVVQAVNEFISSSRNQMRAFCLQHNGFYDVLVQILEK